MRAIVKLVTIANDGQYQWGNVQRKLCNSITVSARNFAFRGNNASDGEIYPPEHATSPAFLLLITLSAASSSLSQ